MAANLPELYENNVGQTGERDVLYTALMPLKSEFTKKTKTSQSYLYNGNS